MDEGYSKFENMLLDTERAIIKTILHKDGQKLHVFGQEKLHNRDIYIYIINT